MKTSLYTILCIAIRLGAVWLGVSVVLAFPGIYKAAGSGSFGEMATTIVLVGSAIALLIALLLWIYPGVLARLAAGKSSTQVFESPISAEQIQQTAFAVLGIWFVMTGLVSLTHEILRTLLFDQVDVAVASGARTWQVRLLLTDATQIVLGCALALGSHGLVGLLRRLRQEGLQPAELAQAQNTNDQAE